MLECLHLAVRPSSLSTMLGAWPSLPPLPDPRPRHCARSRHLEVEVRDQGLAITEEWLKSGRALGELELLRGWKALFFCMWHSDKPRVQLALAQRLGATIALLPTPEAIVHWAECFWVTMNREWSHIDRLRIDKFMWLTRHFLSQSMLIGAERGILPQLLGALARGPLAITSDASSGLRHHVIDCWWDEVARAFSDEHLVQHDLVPVLAPFFTLLSNTPDQVVSTKVRLDIFNALVNRYEAVLEETREDDKPALREQMAARLVPISQRLFDIASSTYASHYYYDWDLIEEKVMPSQFSLSLV